MRTNKTAKTTRLGLVGAVLLGGAVGCEGISHQTERDLNRLAGTGYDIKAQELEEQGDYDRATAMRGIGDFYRGRAEDSSRIDSANRTNVIIVNQGAGRKELQYVFKSAFWNDDNGNGKFDEGEEKQSNFIKKEQKFMVLCYHVAPIKGNLEIKVADEKGRRIRLEEHETEYDPRGITTTSAILFPERDREGVVKYIVRAYLNGEYIPNSDREVFLDYGVNQEKINEDINEIQKGLDELDRGLEEWLSDVEKEYGIIPDPTKSRDERREKIKQIQRERGERDD